MTQQSGSAVCEPLQRGHGYFIDQSHPALFFAAVQGVGDVLEHSLSRLDQDDRDVSPIVFESRSRTLVLNLYEPEPVTIQVVQEEGPLERVTEILGTGVGLGVLLEVRRTARILDLELQPLSERFYKRLSNERTTAIQTYALFRGEPHQKSARYAQVLKAMQDKYRRESHLLRDLL